MTPMAPSAAAAAPAPMPPGAAFHHVGYATESIDRDAALFTALGYVAEGAPFADPIQQVRGLFMVASALPGAPRIELLENLPGGATLTPWLERGTRLYHVACTVPDLAAALAWAQRQRARVAVAPVPAVAFGGRRIAFVVFRHGLMVEFVESEGRPT